ncbi:MAG: hypothetical protein R8J85_10210 [Mariprofundales bacterium]
MTIQLECINFIVPIKIIRKKYPGGWEQCLADNDAGLGDRVWHDEHLFRDGAMNQMDIMMLVWKWQDLGFHTHRGGEKPNKWLDVCVVNSFDSKPTMPCDWIEIGNGLASLKVR